MELPVAGAISRILYLFLLTTFVYLAFVSSGTYAAPYQTSGTYASPYQTIEEIEEEFAGMYERDIQEMCARADASVATRVLCRLVEMRTREAEEEVLSVRPSPPQRVHKRESTSLSAFQRLVTNLRKLAMHNESSRREYQILVQKGLITPSGIVLKLPQTSTRFINQMEEIG